MNLKTNPEFLPLVEWWEKDGKQTVALLAVAAIVVGGWYGWKNYRASVRAAASESLTSAYTSDELEEAVSRFSGQPVGGALKIRLAKSYFDAGRYEEALAQYEALAANPPDGFADIPVVGKAQCLEALGKFAEAAEAFDAFAEANPKSYLLLTAQLGAARSFAQAGDKKKALERIDALKEAEPWLFADAPSAQPGGRTGLPNAGTSTDPGKTMRRWRKLAGLDDSNDNA